MASDRDQKRTKGSGVKLVYDRLRDEILSLALAPGALLDETTLAERFAMSRSPVRDQVVWG
jgi:DNA-binding GntR family transcriptional regulator